MGRWRVEAKWDFKEGENDTRTAEIKFPVVARMRNCFGNYLR